MLMALGLGSAIGAIMALSGAGGGILAVPLLMFGLGVSLAQAAPVGLLAVGMAACLGAFLGLRAGRLRYRAALLMAGGGVLLAPVGIRLASHIDNRWLSAAFAFVLLFVAWRAFRQAKGIPHGRKDKDCHTPPCIVSTKTGRIIWNTRCARVLAMSGGVSGLLSGLLGVGGGFVMVPVLKRYTDLEMKSVIATSLGVIALVSVSGVAFSAFEGRLNWSVAVPFSIGALAGMLAGHRISAHLAGEQLQKCYAAVAATVAVAMIAKILA